MSLKRLKWRRVKRDEEGSVSLFLLVTGRRSGMVVVVGIAMAMTLLGHAFVQALGILEAMLGAGGAEGDQDGGGENGESGFLHETGNTGMLTV